MNQRENGNYLSICKEKFQKIFRYSPASIVISEFDSAKVVDINKSFKRVMGYSYKDVIGKNVLEINIWKNISDREKIMSLLPLQGYVHQPQLELYKKSGEVAIVDCHFSTIKVEDVRYVISHFLDVTNIVQTEQRFTAMFNSIPDAVMFADSDRRIVLNNPAVHTMFGYSNEELVGNSTEMLYADKNDYFEQGKRRYRIGPGAEKKSYEVKYRRKDGSTFWTESIGTQVYDGKGAPIGFIGLFRDITERKQADYKNALLQEQLLQSQKMEAIGQLTGGIAHDFNNILAVILGFANLALRIDTVNQHQQLRSYLEEIVTSGQRARDLIQQMMAFSRKKGSNKQHIQLLPFIKEQMKMLKAALPSSIEFSSKIDDELPSIFIDPVQLQQVIMNICINARDSIGEKGLIDVRVQRYNQLEHRNINNNNLEIRCSSCHKNIDQKEYVEISITDSGDGISKFINKRMFDPFFTTKDPIKGTGMGLSIVHGIIHQHAGHILVKSELGKGTKVSLLFPDGIQGESINSDNESINVTTTKKLENIRVLIVDDEASIARFLHDLVNSEGGIGTISPTGSFAVELFSKNTAAFDVIVTDQTMPKMSGLELAEKILMIRPDMPVVLCTGNSEKIDKDRAKTYGIRAILQKPIDIDELLDTLVNITK